MDKPKISLNGPLLLAHQECPIYLINLESCLIYGLFTVRRGFFMFLFTGPLCFALAYLFITFDPHGPPKNFVVPPPAVCDEVVVSLF